MILALNIFMKKVLLTILLFVFSNVLFAQYTPVPKNIITTSLSQFLKSQQDLVLLMNDVRQRSFE